MDLFFPPGSATVTREQQVRIQEFACRVEQRRHEYVITVGHTDNRERAVKDLALARAHNALAALAAAGVQGTQSAAEGKGAAQPVADNKTPEGRSKNRRVEIETMSRSTPESKALDPGRCSPAWKAQLLSLDGATALAFARNQAREGWVSPQTLMRTVIEARRLDLFEAFWRPRIGLPLDREQRRSVFLHVLMRGTMPMVKSALEAGWPLLRSHREPLESAICHGAAGADVVRLLIARGAQASKTPAGELPLLKCAVPHKGLAVVQQLLDAGADPHEVQGIVALASIDRTMIDRLLAAGANPLDKLPKSYGGGTLFHVMPIKETADIQWLQSLGLDINERDASGRTPLADKLRRADEKLLDTMIEAGATLDEPEYGLLHAAIGNVPASLWLLRHGASLTRYPGLTVSWVRQGDKALPVMEAYRARGGDMNARDHRGHSALSEAIASLQPTMITFLLGAGADASQVAPGVSAQAMAEAIDVRPLLVCGVVCMPAAPPGTVDATRQAAKIEILRLLREASAVKG
ncbi:MAG: OmpA family protein [Pseudomonadota bacterium]